MSHPGSEEEYKLFEEVQKIAGFILRSSSGRLEDRCDSHIRTLREQTTRGIFLELTDSGLPTTLWTPWGSWRFIGRSKGDWPESLQHYILTYLGAVRYNPVGEHGERELGRAVYAIHKVGGTKLPEPTERLSDFPPNDQLEQAWAEMLERYSRHRVR